MRKVLSFVLVLTLVLSSFSMAFAADAAAAATSTAAGLTDISASPNSQAIEVSNNLGIVTGNPDGTFQPEKAVNRAEFAAMITRALGIPSSALAGYTSTSFKDTTGYGWAVPYLAFCQSKGIILGDGAGNVMPGRTINTNEAATMVLRALGYTSNSSALVGVWPSNYVSLAQDLGIYDSTASATNVDKQNAAQMIYNALSVQKVQVAADGTTTQLKDANDDPVTMLTSGLGCSDEGYSIVTYDADAVINTVPYIADLAKVYQNSDGNIIAIDDVKGKTLKGTYHDVAPAGFGVGDYVTVDDVDYTFEADVRWDNPGTTTVENNASQYFLNGNKEAAFPATLTDGGTYTFNAKLSNKTITELYSAENWTASAAAKIVAGDLASIADGSFLGYDFATDKNDKIIDKSFLLVGAKSLSDIKADNVVIVYNDDNRDEISKVLVGTQIVEGKVTKVNATDKEWTVGGKVYAFGLDGANGSKAYANELNSDVKLYLDGNGDIYKYDVTSGAAKDYAVIVQMDTGGTNDGNMKLYLADDSKKTFTSDFDEWAWVKVNANNTNNGHRLVGYGVDKDGVIDGIYPQVAADAGAWVTGASTFKSNTVVTMAGTDRTIDPDAVVFTEDATGVVNGVAKIADVDKNTNAPIAGVEGLVRDGDIVALIVDENYVSGSGDSQYAVVSAADSAVNPAGDKAQVLSGYIDGKKMADDTVYTSGQTTVTDWENVHLYKIKYNDDKNISKADIQPAVVTDTAITANGYISDGYIKTGANGVNINAVASDAVYYEVVFETEGNNTSGIDKYKPFNGTIYSGMEVWMYDTDTSSDHPGAEVVIIDKNGVATYSEPTFTVAARTATVASNAATTVGTITAYDYTNDDTTNTMPNIIDDFAVTAVTAGTGAGTGDFAVVADGSDVVITYDGGGVTTAGAVTLTVRLRDGNSNTVSHDFSFTFN